MPSTWHPEHFLNGLVGSRVQALRRALSWGPSALALAGAALATPGREGQAEPRQPPAEARSADEPHFAPREVVAHLGALQSQSTVRFANVSEKVAPHRLVACFVFPDRARLAFERPSPGDPEPFRSFYYRAGDLAFGAVLGAASTRYEGAERDVLVRQLELRRALMLFPDGFDWRADAEDAARRSVAIPGLGRFEARLDASGRPARIEAFDPAGELADGFVVSAWRDDPRTERSWPAAVELEYAGAPVWSETIEDVDTRVFALDSAFLPPDRRARGPASERELAPAQRLRVAARAVRRTPIEAVDWTAALERERELRAAWALAGGAEPEPGPVFELDPAGRPAAVLLRLPPGVPAPAGFALAAESEALALSALESVAELGAALARRLFAELPDGAQPGTWYVRLGTLEPLAGPVQVVLPFAPPE